ncbi:sensor histidine kinase [Lysinibacillus endophyticus]|uniref:sensor histidine kinase n=1 Tax=Ureibacillus endophyticus TaxID=1978490 RepID=UPI00209E3DC9|nr:HAMP domain-containing sensor histidine kinase [Lysinibacillus endophyticus]MCP1146142.1 HAMP domain-containing histidine kinase [Lysinibacillus endophyticus]
MKLRTKIHLFTTLLMLLLLVIMNIGIYSLYEKITINTELKQLQSRGEELLATLSQMEQTIDPATVLRAYMPTNGAIRVLSSNGVEITAVEAPDALDGLNLNLNEISSLIDSSTILIQLKAIWINGEVVDLQLIQKLDDVVQNQQLLKLVLVAVTVLIAIPILLSNMALTRIILKPLERLSIAMKKSGTSGTYEKLEIVEGKDELAEIGRTFNTMMEALETNYKKQEQFVSNASHELKTPLTVIESYAKLLLRRGFSNEKVAQEALDAIVSESSRMNDMIVQMLELAKNKEHLSLTVENINLTKLLENTLEEMRQAYNRTFSLQCDEGLFIQSDEQKLKQLLFIILDNARKYSDENIDVQVVKENDSVKVDIQDYGVGIPQDQLPHLFDRFFRVHQDRSRKTGGTGLGLAIAKDLAEILQIQIEVESELNVGTCFTLQIPLTFLNGEDNR